MADPTTADPRASRRAPGRPAAPRAAVAAALALAALVNVAIGAGIGQLAGEMPAPALVSSRGAAPYAGRSGVAASTPAPERAMQATPQAATTPRA